MPNKVVINQNCGEIVSIYSPGPQGPQGPQGQSGSQSSYKVYTALLTQIETDAPVATVLENTIGNIYWIRQTTGGYQGILLNAFIPGKSWAVATGDAIAGDFVQIGFNDENTVQIWNYDLCSGTCSLIDGTAIYIEIRVYN